MGSWYVIGIRPMFPRAYPSLHRLYCESEGSGNDCKAGSICKYLFSATVAGLVAELYARNI
jgi:hypothetical protein